MEETRIMEAPDQRDRHVIRRTAELLASDVPLRDVFSQFCRLLSSVIDASRVFIALHEKSSLRIVYMLVDGTVGAPDDADIHTGSQSAHVAETGESIIKRVAVAIGPRRARPSASSARPTAATPSRRSTFR